MHGKPLQGLWGRAASMRETRVEQRTERDHGGEAGAEPLPFPVSLQTQEKTVQAGR